MTLTMTLPQPALATAVQTILILATTHHLIALQVIVTLLIATQVPAK